LLSGIVSETVVSSITFPSLFLNPDGRDTHCLVPLFQVRPFPELFLLSGERTIRNAQMVCLLFCSSPSFSPRCTRPACPPLSSDSSSIFLPPEFFLDLTEGLVMARELRRQFLSSFLAAHQRLIRPIDVRGRTLGLSCFVTGEICFLTQVCVAFFPDSNPPF